MSNRSIRILPKLEGINENKEARKIRIAIILTTITSFPGLFLEKIPFKTNGPIIPVPVKLTRANITS